MKLTYTILLTETVRTQRTISVDASNASEALELAWEQAQSADAEAEIIDAERHQNGAFDRF